MIEPSSSRTLDRTFSAMKRTTSSGIGQLEVIEVRLLSQDGDAVLEVRAARCRRPCPTGSGRRGAPRGPGISDGGRSLVRTIWRPPS